VAAAMLVVPAIASAQVRSLVASLDPGQEFGVGAPVPGSLGRGLFTGLLDVSAGTLSFTLDFSDLLGTTVAVGALGAPAHIHAPALPGSNAGIDLHIVGVPVGVQAFSVSGSFTGLNAGQVGNLLNGLTYVNIHTTARGAGEIRGQISAVPEPSTYALMASGLLVLGGIARRRRA
jgi:hypothetical protein